MDDNLEHKWDHLEPPTKVNIVVTLKFWKIGKVIDVLKGLFKKKQ